MLQTAIFVDAGYLFAAGSNLICGEKKPRHLLSINVAKVLSALERSAVGVENRARLLRIYWYDGISQNRAPSSEQTALGLAPNVKLRLGFVNNQRQQKGVDSLIVTDLIDLARNNAIHDALILAGDEDLRVGVQIAQTYGVRIHLLGVTPARGNQSLALAQEADSLTEWGEEEVKGFLSLSNANKIVVKPILSQPHSSTLSPDLNVKTIAASIHGRFSDTELTNIRKSLEATGSLPRDVDGPMLALGRDEIGRELDLIEKRELRAFLIGLIKG